MFPVIYVFETEKFEIIKILKVCYKLYLSNLMTKNDNDKWLDFIFNGTMSL